MQFDKKQILTWYTILHLTFAAANDSTCRKSECAILVEYKRDIHFDSVDESVMHG